MGCPWAEQVKRDPYCFRSLLSYFTKMCQDSPFHSMSRVVMAPRALVEDQPFFAALWLSSASYISHVAEYRMLLLGLSPGSISIWPYFICPLPWYPTFLWKCARISLVVWWFFGTIVGCLNALAKVVSHSFPPTFSAPPLSVRLWFTTILQIYTWVPLLSAIESSL